MAILLEGYWAHVRCDDTSHLPEDKSASKELHGRTRDDLVQQAALLGWRLGGGIVLCPIHAHVEQGSEARKRLRSIAQQRISMLASGTGPNDAVVQAFASRGALEALSCLPHEAEFYFDEGLDLPGGPGSTVLRPLDEDPMLGKLFMLNVDRRGDRIEPPGVSSKPWGSASGTLVLQNDEPQTGAS